MKTVIKIEGMMCGHCEKAVKEELEKISDVKKVKADYKRQMATITSDVQIDPDMLKKAVEDAGYTLIE